MSPYTRRQLALLLAALAAVGGGLAVGRWRRAHPELVERLERLDRNPEVLAAEERARAGAPRARPARPGR